MSKQLRRWSHGFIQNVRLHWRNLLSLNWIPFLVSVSLWDATIASLAYLVLVPLAAILIHPAFLIGYIIDLPLIAVPVLIAGARRGEFLRALSGLPCFAVLRILNAIHMLRAVWAELIVNRPLLVYEKGH